MDRVPENDTDIVNINLTEEIARRIGEGLRVWVTLLRGIRTFFDDFAILREANRRRRHRGPPQLH